MLHCMLADHVLRDKLLTCAGLLAAAGYTICVLSCPLEAHTLSGAWPWLQHCLPLLYPHTFAAIPSVLIFC